MVFLPPSRGVEGTFDDPQLQGILSSSTLAPAVCVGDQGNRAIAQI